MNTRLFSLVAVAAVGLANVQAEDAPEFKSDKEKANYAYGLNTGSAFKQNNLEFDSDAFVRGVMEGLEGKGSLNPQQQREAYMKYLQERRAALGEKNKSAGEAFLAANKTKPGVKTTASGLQYKVLGEGSGESPKADDICVVRYRGTLIDGTEFDSSEKAPGGSASFAANRVIPGWTEALTNMSTGAKWQLAIPSQLAYGESGRGANIGPN